MSTLLQSVFFGFDALRAEFVHTTGVCSKRFVYTIRSSRRIDFSDVLAVNRADLNPGVFPSGTFEVREDNAKVGN